jgi:signal transduction histidine kinase
MPHRVLCIESDAPIREQLRHLLEANGFAVEESATGLDGIARVRSAAPDLVLADTCLPDVEGLELAARIKRDRTLAQVPVVAVGRSPGDHDAALAAGCDGFIACPIDAATFADDVKAYLSGKRERLSGDAEQYARQLLAERERRGSAFVRDLAHELSTPLTPLSGYLKILASGRLGELSAQQRKVVDGMTAAVGKLTRVLENLSDFASLQAGTAAITPAAVDPDALVEDVVNEVRGAARDARVHLEVRPAGGNAVAADPRKLRQALANVVQNAVKFSPHGGEVLVEVSRDAGTVRFAVYDQGPGIAACNIDRIFEPFRRPERTGDARFPGSGLGLPVARRIAEAHGGRVMVESPPYSQPSTSSHHYMGAKFLIEIPARPAEPALPQIRASGA